MSIVITSNPIVGTETIFAGFDPVTLEFKREDLAITSVTSGAGSKAQINLATDLTSYLSPGDSLYFYSPATNFNYDKSAKITSITATEILTDTDYIETGGVGYINYLKNYYVEIQLVNKTNTNVNILPFNITSDGAPSGIVKIDLNIANDLNSQSYAISTRQMAEACTSFRIKYREVSLGVPGSFTLIENKLATLVYATDTIKQKTILNSLDQPKLYIGYDNAFTTSKKGSPASTTMVARYTELNINFEAASTTQLATVDAAFSGIYMFKWGKGDGVSSSAKYLDFRFSIVTSGDFLAGDFATPDFKIS